MAIDTKSKRFSMLNFGDGVVSHHLFEPDGTVDADDRNSLLGLYNGIASGSPPAPPSTTSTYFFQKFILGH